MSSPRTQDAWPLADSELRPALAFALALEHAPMGVLMLRSETSDTLEPVLAEGLTDEQSSSFGSHRPGIGPVGVAFAEHRHVSIKDAAEDSEEFQTLGDVARHVGFRGLDVVPVFLDNSNVIGAVAALFRTPRRPSARSTRLAESAARLLALALDHARLRAQAERRRDAAESLARARVQFVARMSHELRTPLQSITGYIDLLSLGWPEALTSRQRDMLDRVRKSEQILINVIDDLVSFARLEAGAVEYHVGPVAASEVMSLTEVIMAPLAQHQGVRLEVTPAAEHFIAQADDGKLKQVLINLLTNAVKFTPSGGCVRLTCRQDADALYFEVSDDGPGIPSNKLGDVFQPYVQLANGSTNGLHGSGLGLAISREFAIGMGGSLTVTSAPGKGSVFTLQVQRHAEDSLPWHSAAR